MLNHYYGSSQAMEGMRSGCVGPHLDGFVEAMAAAGYTPNTIREYVRTTVHLGRWADRHGIALSTFDEEVLQRFRKHLSSCRCTVQSLGVFSHALSNARHFLAYLVKQLVIVQATPSAPAPVVPAIAERFASWMIRHRGVVSGTAVGYQLRLQPFLEKLGDDPGKYDPEGIRQFVIDHLTKKGREEARTVVTAIRAFLRFLVAEGSVRSGIEYCVPTVPRWRLSSLPRFLEAPDVERVVNSCNLSTRHGRRDQAILLLLARLGLRAGDIFQMKLEDIDWNRGTLRVRGKGRRDVLLPLPQDVGDAVAAYLMHGRPKSIHDTVFLCANAPPRPFSTSSSVSDVVRLALKRAGIRNPPSRGAHLLRHSAATAMLRGGSSLDSIATVMRHRSTDTTAYYAKVDVNLLLRVAQPWPGGASC